MNADRVAKLREILQQDPADSFSQYALALEYASGGKPDEAIRQMETLIAADPTYVPAYQQLGYLYQLGGKTAAAREAFLRGIVAAHAQSDHHAAGEMQEALDELA